MGVPTSEVGYTSAMPRREDHEVHNDMWGHGGGGTFGTKNPVKLDDRLYTLWSKTPCFQSFHLCTDTLLQHFINIYIAYKTHRIMPGDCPRQTRYRCL